MSSTRPYERVDDIRRMVSRSAYAQLGYSPLMLLGCTLGMALTFLAGPLLALVVERACPSCSEGWCGP